MVSLVHATAALIRLACRSTRRLRDVEGVRRRLLCATAVKSGPALLSTRRLRDLTGAHRRANFRRCARGAGRPW